VIVNFRILALAAHIALVLGLLVACGNDDEGDDGRNGPLQVLGSTSIVADWVEQVGGEHVEVDSIVPWGTDVHAFVAAPGDIRKIGDADLIFIVGEHLESGFEGEIQANANGRIVVLTEGMTLDPFPDSHEHEDNHGHARDDDDDHGHDDDGHFHDDDDEHGHDDNGHAHDNDDEHGHDDNGHAHGEFDPHIWMSPDLVIQAVERIRDTLVEMDPDNADDYRARAETYTRQIREMDEEIAGLLAGLPENRRYVVTFHDAYGYFAARYGLTLVGFVVENPEAQPSAARYARLVDEIRERNIPYIFKEPQFDARVIEQLARDTGAQVRAIPSDALSDDVPDYLSLLRAIASGIAGE
jgi:zinc/manganese transport system substrate-binding protein